jgi:hypothetical protein
VIFCGHSVSPNKLRDRIVLAIGRRAIEAELLSPRRPFDRTDRYRLPGERTAAHAQQRQIDATVPPLPQASTSRGETTKEA